MRGDLFGDGETRSGGGRLGLDCFSFKQARLGSADRGTRCACSDFGGTRSQSTDSQTQSHRAASVDVLPGLVLSGLVWSCLVSSATPAFSLDAQLVASYEPGFRWCDWTSRFRYAPGALRSQTFLSPLPCLMPCWHDAAAIMFNSLKPGSSPVHQVVEVPARLFQRTNLFFQAYIFNAFGSQAVSMHVLNSGDSR